ncbi:MAG: hypothetical protein FWD05_02360 [Oscillospiraceae bacterium]|nr:hypothetical protein [Oscillospiraceae bacterium]
MQSKKLIRKTKMKVTAIITIMAIAAFILSLTALAMAEEAEYGTYEPPIVETPVAPPPPPPEDNQGSEPEPGIPDVPDTPDSPETPDEGGNAGGDEGANIDAPSEGNDGNNETDDSYWNDEYFFYYDNDGNRRPIDLGTPCDARGAHTIYVADDFYELQQLISEMSTRRSYTVILSDLLMPVGITIPAGVNVTLTGENWQTELVLETENERHFTVYGTLRLHSNIILEGAHDPTFNHGGVEVGDGGYLLMSGTGDGYNGSMIVGNTATMGGGVNVNTGGTVIMYPGSTIMDNTANEGGGVNVDTEATFVMYGGDVFGNFASYQGGGIAIIGGTLVMSGGEIFANDSSWGGGVAVYGGVFTMSDGMITNNFTTDEGGGIALRAQSSFIMYDGHIAYNFAYDESLYASGGGVFVQDSEFFMYDGEILNNISSMGGNVAVWDGMFTMYDGLLDDGLAIAGDDVFYYGNSTVTVSDASIAISAAIPAEIFDIYNATDIGSIMVDEEIVYMGSIEIGSIFARLFEEYNLINYSFESVIHESSDAINEFIDFDGILQIHEPESTIGSGLVLLLISLLMLISAKVIPAIRRKTRENDVFAQLEFAVK